MNKKRTIALGLALILMISIASLAYFTDVKTGDTVVQAGIVSLTDNTEKIDTKLMVPGDTRTLNLNAVYDGNVDAQVRVRLFDAVGAVPVLDQAEGFQLKNGEEIYDLSADGAVVIIDDVDNVVVSDAPEESVEIELPSLEIELLAASTNDYQDATFSVSYEIQVLQANEVTWAVMDEGEIGIEPYEPN